MDLHQGEEVVFEGHPTWRAILGFYVIAFVGAVLRDAATWIEK